MVHPHSKYWGTDYPKAYLFRDSPEIKLRYEKQECVRKIQKWLEPSRQCDRIALSEIVYETASGSSRRMYLWETTEILSAYLLEISFPLLQAMLLMLTAGKAVTLDSNPAQAA